MRDLLTRAPPAHEADCVAGSEGVGGVGHQVGFVGEEVLWWCMRRLGRKEVGGRGRMGGKRFYFAEEGVVDLVCCLHFHCFVHSSGGDYDAAEGAGGGHGGWVLRGWRGFGG